MTEGTRWLQRSIDYLGNIRERTIVFLSRALTEPPIQTFEDDRKADGIAFMQGLVRFAEKHGEESRFNLLDGVTLRLLRVRDDG